ncbi:MAG: type VI secretion system tip protein VgrG [Bacteroidetes bacterium]|nr:type VI secretion system tip protein VgrG [Bacteroidota bacterium]
MGLDSMIPGTGPATDVTSCKVFINGNELTNEILVSSVTVNKTFNKIASAKLVFNDGSVAARDFVLSNDDRFKPGNAIEVQLGYYSNTDTVFEGIIIKHAVKILSNGATLLLIEAKDKAIKLTGARKNNYFINKTDKEVITSLAGESTPDVDPLTFRHKQLVQFGATDWDFILTRAEANSMLVLTDDGTLSVKQPVIKAPVVTATYGANIYEFEAEMDARRQVKTVTGNSWDYTKQTNESSTNGTATLEEAGNLSSDDLGSVLAADLKLTHSGHLTQDQLQNWANAWAMRNKLSKAVGRVKIQGNAEVKPGTSVMLDGVGDRFNGSVYVTGIMHEFDGTWRTDVQFGWCEDWFYKKEDVMDKPAAGLLPGINGLQVGLVVSTDDTEDGGQYRVKVHVPLITSGNDGIWARVAALDAGDKRGAYFRPQKNDEVVLGFLNDDPREPIILGYLHSKSAHQSPLPQTQGNLEYGFVTKENIKLIFDDTNKRMTLSVKTTKGEKSIVLNDASGAFSMTDENQNTIKMDSTGITIQAGKGNVTIKGTNVLIN